MAEDSLDKVKLKFSYCAPSQATARLLIPLDPRGSNGREWVVCLAGFFPAADFLLRAFWLFRSNRPFFKPYIFCHTPCPTLFLPVNIVRKL